MNILLWTLGRECFKGRVWTRASRSGPCNLAGHTAGTRDVCGGKNRGWGGDSVGALASFPEEATAPLPPLPAEGPRIQLFVSSPSV